MDQVPKYLIFLMAGGMALLLLKESVAFIKWAVRAIAKLSGEKPNPMSAINQTVSQGNIEQKVNVEQDKEGSGDIKYEMLKNIFDCTSETNQAVGELAVEMATVKTQVGFMAGKQGEQNGELKTLNKTIGEMKEACATRLLSCEKRFSGLHEKVVKEIKIKEV